jgi:Flp pilus assembly protein TadD
LEKSLERTFIRLLFGGILAVIILIVAIWGAHGAYVRWQEKRLIRRAVAAFEHGDDRMAALAARSVLEFKPASADANRIMAQVSEHIGDRSAVDWRRKVVELEPHSAEDTLALARCALQFGDTAGAERALLALDESGRKTAGYHAVTAMIAQSRHQNEKADAEWNKAIELSPGEPAYKLQLGLLRLRSKEEQSHKAGKAILKELVSDSKYRASATRALITESITRQEDMSEILEVARDLQSYPEATFNDHLLYLSLLHQLGSEQFIAYLTELESQTRTKPLELAMLLSWMSANQLNLLALDFVKGLSQITTQTWPVPITVAEIRAKLRDWDGLEALVKNVQWGQFEFLRHAYLALAFRKQDHPAAAEREWSLAQKMASAEPQFLATLARTTNGWGWQNETVELLWALAKHPQKQREALHELYLRYADSEDTAGLYRVLLRLAEIEPNDLTIQNNLAQISLLLNVDVERARKIAADVYWKERSKPGYASTYAFALYTKGDVSGALKVMNELSPSDLRDPSVATYYAIFLAASGNTDRAEEYLKLASAAKLLWEEKELVRKAANSLK